MLTMRVIAGLCVCLSVSAAEGATNFDPPKPGPQPTPTVRSTPTMPRPVMAYEIETMVMTPGDSSGLAAWAELAAHGFHLITVVPHDGKQVLFFERQRNPTSADIRLPAAVASDASLAEAVQAKLRQIINERQQAAAAGRPPTIPQPAKEIK